jgi:hypothetical protein
MDDYRCSHTLAALLNPPSRDTPAWGHTAAWGHRLSAVVGFGFFRCAMSPSFFAIAVLWPIPNPPSSGGSTASPGELAGRAR